MDNKVAIIGHSFIERLEESLGSGDFPFGKNLGVEGSEIRYFGLRGATSKSLLHSSDMTKCERFRPNKIFIQIGGNDINGDSTVTSVCESIQNLIEHLCKLDSVNDIIVGSIFQRRNPRGLTSETFNCEASKINNFLERFYRNYTRVHFWRLRGLQKPKWDIFLADGVHLNKDAALIYARSTFIYLARIFRGETVHLAEAQDFIPVTSCSSGLSTFAGIVCSGNYVDGKAIHCIFDDNFQLGLVCTEWQQTLPGRCPRYLEEFKEVGVFPCAGGECPDVFFPSHDAYKYPACLNKSLYITEPTTTPADTTEQSISCRDCVDGGSSGQSMSRVVPIVINVIVLMTSFCLLVVWEYCTKKSLQEVICGSLNIVYCGHRATDNEQVTQREAKQGMASEEEDTDHREEKV